MKIALIAPPYPLEEAPSPPLGLTYIAAVCEAMGAEVIILDYIVRGYSVEKLQKEIMAFRPDIVGTNSVTMNFNSAASILTAVKEFDPTIITMMGGPHISWDVQNSLINYPCIDFAIRGEGEETLKELLTALKNSSACDHIPGIAFRKNDEIIITEPRALIEDVDTIPMPARHLLPMARYQALGFPVSIITSRGCPNKCIFCLGRKMVGFKVRYRSTPKVVDEIEEIMTFGITNINIADDLFTSNHNRVKAFCNEILDRNLNVTWSVFSRVNTIDEEILAIMKKAGCHSISFGIESGNPEMLKKVRKGITVEQALFAAGICKKAGITPHASFIVGLPGETMETLQDSHNLQQKMDIAYGYHFLAPFPGTTVYENCDEYDLKILTRDWDKYDANSPVVETSGLTPEKMVAFVDSSYKKQTTEWEAAVRRYNDENCSDDDYLRVGGWFRMHLIFRILSEDIIEKSGDFCSTITEALPVLTDKIARLTDNKKAFVETILKDLIQKDYIRFNSSGTRGSFAWQ